MGHIFVLAALTCSACGGPRAAARSFESEDSRLIRRLAEIDESTLGPALLSSNTGGTRAMSSATARDLTDQRLVGDKIVEDIVSRAMRPSEYLCADVLTVNDQLSALFGSDWGA